MIATFKLAINAWNPALIIGFTVQDCGCLFIYTGLIFSGMCGADLSDLPEEISEDSSYENESPEDDGQKKSRHRKALLRERL
jgi:hypothetical protein